MRHSKQQAASTKRRIHSGKETRWNNVFRCVMNVSRSRACYRSYTFTYRSIHITWLLFCFSPDAWTPVIFGVTFTHTHTRRIFFYKYHSKCTRYSIEIYTHHYISLLTATHEPFSPPPLSAHRCLTVCCPSSLLFKQIVRVYSTHTHCIWFA